MMAPSHLGWLNMLLPGCGLILRGRLGLGSALFLPALAAATLAPLVAVVAVDGFRVKLLAVFIAAYVVLAGLAALAWWWQARQERWDPGLVRELHRNAAAAFLRGEHAVARQAAERLCAAAQREPGAWTLLGMAAAAAGDAPAAAAAHRRAGRLRQQDEA